MTNDAKPAAGSNGQHPVFRVQRIGAAVIALILWVFAVLGFVGHVGFFSTRGAHVAGLTTNGLLSTVSLVVGAVLVLAAVRGGRMSSTTCIVVGGLFVLGGLLSLFVLNTSADILAFTMPNVAFSLVVGLILLSIGLYGRGSGQLPPDSPYRQERGGVNPMSRIWHDEDLAQEQSADPEADERRLAEINDMAEAEHAVAEGSATPEQRRKVTEDTEHRTRQRRTAAWRRAERDEVDR
jgi:hypothetical protein